MTDFLQLIGTDLREAAERRASRRRRSMVVRASLVVCVLIAAVGLWTFGAGMLTSDDRQAAGERESTNRDQIAPAPLQTESASCEIGAKPEYFVPGDDPLAVVGCARLPVSGQVVEFSANLSRIDGAEHLCVNPAYSNGRYIPAICKLDPPVSKFAVRAASQPRHGANGYSYVVWGTGLAESVVAKFDDGGVAHAARIVVPAEAARDYGVERFGLFVVELPLSAACAPVTIEADGVTASVEPEAAACRAAARSRGA
jgi:hypothetical protein